MDRRLGFSCILLCLCCLTSTNYAQNTAIYQYGIFNAAGQQILPFEYDAVQQSNDGNYLILKKDDQLVYLDQSGKTLVKPMADSTASQLSRFTEIPSPSKKYDLALRYQNGYVKVRSIKNKKGGILNLKGKEIVKCNYDWFYLEILENGLIKGKEGNSYHLFDANGKELGKFDDIGQRFVDGRLLVVKDDYFGYVDESGQLVLPAIYTRARAFANRHAFVIQDDTACYINPQGEKTITLPVSTHDGQAFQNQVVVVKDKNDNYSVVHAAGEVSFTLPLSYLDNYMNNLAAAKKTFEGDTWGVVDKTGKAIIPFEYHETKVYNVKGTSFIAIRKAQTAGAKVVEGTAKTPSLTAKAYCYTAVLQTPKINALGATQLHTQALFVELYAPYRMPSDEVKKRGKEIALKKYPKAQISQEFFTEVKNCLEIRSKLATQLAIDQSELIEEHID